MAYLDNNVVVETFPVNTYVLILSLFALVVCPYADLLDMSTLAYVIRSDSAYMMLFSVINLMWKLPNIPTIQKPYVFRQFSPLGVAAALKQSPPFTGTNFKRW